MAVRKVHVAIFDDHQSAVDGYHYRLDRQPEIEIVGAAGFGDELDDLLAHGKVDVLILDVSVPTSRANDNPYPVVHRLPKLLDRYPSLAVLVISMVTERTMIKALIDAGASGYILKEDQAAQQELAAVVLSVAKGGIYFSQRAFDLMRKYGPKPDEPMLTPRQWQALSISAAYPGEPLANLAGQLHVSQSTLRNLLHEAYARLGVRNRTEAILKARELGLVAPPLRSGPE